MSSTVSDEPENETALEAVAHGHCIWKGCQAKADPAVDGSGPFDQWLCPKHDEVPVEDLQK